MSRTVSSQDAVTASSMHQKAMSRRLFAWRRRATDATELFDDDEHFDYLNDIQGEGGVDNSNGSRASKSRFRRWGRAHSTGKVMQQQRSGSAERPARTQSAERGGGRTPATPSVLATPAAAVATPAVLMASYDSAKGRLPPSGRHYKTPYQERQLLYSAQQQQQQHSRSFAARQTPVNLAALKRDMQQQRPPVAAAGGRRPPLRQQDHTSHAAGNVACSVDANQDRRLLGGRPSAQ